MSSEPYAPEVTLDRNSPIPLYFQISEPLEKLITSNSFPPGTRIEDELSMAARLQVSRPTARRALQRLVDQGLVVRRRGIGTLVAPHSIRRPMQLTSLHSDLERLGHRATTELLGYEERECTPDEAGELQLADGTAVVALGRLRFSDGDPIAVLHNVVPATVAPTREELQEGGLYDAMRQRGVQLLSARQSIGARTAGAEEVRLLNLRRGAAVLTMRRTTIDQNGHPVEIGDHTYRADRYTFDTTVFSA